MIFNLIKTNCKKLAAIAAVTVAVFFAVTGGAGLFGQKSESANAAGNLQVVSYDILPDLGDFRFPGYAAITVHAYFAVDYIYEFQLQGSFSGRVESSSGFFYYTFNRFIFHSTSLQLDNGGGWGSLNSPCYFDVTFRFPLDGYQLLRGWEYDLSLTFRVDDYSGLAFYSLTDIWRYPSEPLALPPDPVRPHYEFKGWYLDEALTEAYDGRPIYADTALYAKWELRNYVITYVGASVASETYPAFTVISTKLATLTRAGWAFLGWFYDDACTAPVGQTDELTSDVTLYAAWERVTVTVTFISNGEVISVVSIPVGGSFTQALQAAGLSLSMYSVTGISAVSGDYVELNGDDSAITDDVVLTVEELTLPQKVQNVITEYWRLGLGAIVLIAAVAVIVPLFSRKRKYRY